MIDRLVLIGVLIVCLFASGGAVAAQAQPPELTVTLHDVAGAPLAGVTVLVRDAGGSQTLAQAATDAQGSVSFASLSARQVRVAVAGALPQGPRLYQPGDDAAGIRLLISPSPVTLALRSAADGLVAPDPAAMASEPGVPRATSPVARSALPLSAAPAGGLPPAGVAAPGVTSRPLWAGLAGLILLIGAGVGIILAQRRAV